MSLQAGDIVLTRSETLFGRMIRLFTRSFGERRTQVNHAGIMVNDREIVEALSPRVVKRDLFQAYGKPNNKTQVAIFRMPGLTARQKAIIVRDANAYVGRRYGWIKIIAQGLDALLGHIYFFRRFTKMDRYPICSWIVAWCYHNAGVRFDLIPPGAADPDDIWDWCQLHLDETIALIHPLRKVTERG